MDVYLKDIDKTITDPFTLSTLYASALTKFINYATSFEMREATMYRSAYRLGIESFLIDLRHLCAHGKQIPNIEVFRKSHRYCLNWIKQYFWENELNNISDASAKDARLDPVLMEKLSNILTFYDTFAELLHKNINNLDDIPSSESSKTRWPTIIKFMKQHKLKTIRKAFNFLSAILKNVVESKAMNLNPRTFFSAMFEHCDYFFQVTEVSDVIEEGNKSNLSYDDEEEEEIEDEDDETEADESPTKRRKTGSLSMINLYHGLIWQIARQDYLKLLLDMLYQMSATESEDVTRRASARFWIVTLLRSFSYYQRYCNFPKTNAILQTKITGEVRNIYNYQFDADLKKVFIFVGTQLLPSSLKYSKDFFMQLLNNVNEDTEDVCISLLPFVYPPLTPQQLENIDDLIKIGTSKKRKNQDAADKVYTVEDLISLTEAPPVDESDLIWKPSLDNIDWSTEPIGTDFLCH